MTTQMLKGILEGCILAIINKEAVYGYELAHQLRAYGFTSFSEGTIYPLLLRMQREGLLTSTFKKSTAGPRRKYYSLSVKGEAELRDFIKHWRELAASVQAVLKDQNDGGFGKDE